MHKVGISTYTTKLMDELYLPRVAIGVVREVSSSYLSIWDAVRLCKNRKIRRMIKPTIRTNLQDVQLLRIQRLKAIGVIYCPGLFVLAARVFGLLGR